MTNKIINKLVEKLKPSFASAYTEGVIDGINFSIEFIKFSGINIDDTLKECIKESAQMHLALSKKPKLKG